MSASPKQLYFQLLLLLVSCRHINTKTNGPTPEPSGPNNPLPTEVKSFDLKGEISTEKVELLNPVNLVLECNWTSAEPKIPNITGHWRRDGAEIENSRLTVQLVNEQYNLRRQFRIDSKETLGNYSCVFGNEAKIDFILTGPQIAEVRDKPIISYIGDSAVMSCKLEKNQPKPNSWNWYKANGTEKNIIVAELNTYNIENKEEEKSSKLVVHSVTEANSGWYYCEAVYNISTTMSHVELQVICFWEPLKPFLAILVEVIVLVAAILLYERSQSKKNCAEGNGTNSDQTNTLTQGENNGPEASSSMRQRKV